MEIIKRYQQTEIGLIPSDWQVIRLGDVFIFKNGLNKEKRFFGKGTPIINYMDVYKNVGITSKDLKGKVSLSSQEIKNYDVKKGDVFFTRTSETPDEIGMTAVVLEDLQNTVFSGFVLRARPILQKLQLEFKKYCFASPRVRKDIISTSSYTTRALTNGRLLSNIKLTLPPQSEQTAIATALSDTDALISSLEKLIAKKRSIKQGTMQELLKPKKGWEMKRLGEIGTVIRGASPRPQGDKRYYGGSVPRLMVEDVTRDGKFVTPRVDFLTEEGAQKSRPCKKGTLTIVCSGTVGVVSILAVDACIHDGFLALIDIKSKYSTDYLYHKLSTLQNQFDNSATHGGIFTNLTTSSIRDFETSFPPIENQIEIANILSDMDAEIAVLEFKLKKYYQIKSGMMQNLLTGKIRLI